MLLSLEALHIVHVCPTFVVRWHFKPRVFFYYAQVRVIINVRFVFYHRCVVYVIVSLYVNTQRAIPFWPSIGQGVTYLFSVVIIHTITAVAVFCYIHIILLHLLRRQAGPSIQSYQWRLKIWIDTTIGIRSILFY